MSKYSSDSNSRDRNRSYRRYFNQRHRSSSSSSTENSRNSKNSSRKLSSRSRSSHKKSKCRRRSSSSSDYSSSKNKYSSRNDESRSRKKSHKRSSSNSGDSNYSNSSRRTNQASSSKTYSCNEKHKTLQSNSSSTIHVDKLEVKSETVKPEDQDLKWYQKNVDDVMKRENSIKQIKQEGFVFNVFKPSEQNEEEITNNATIDLSNCNDEIINSLSVDESTFIITSRERILNAKYKLLTKQERINKWAKYLFESFKQLERDGDHLDECKKK